MADNDLIIKIGASSKQFQEELDKIKKSTEDFENQLGKIAQISAVAFAGLSAEIGLSVHEFAQSEAASRALVQALQTQGIASTELVNSYKAQADALEKKTGIDNDAIVKGQALLQGYLGQTEVSEKLTKAVLELSVAQGIGLEEAFGLVGKSLSTNTNLLARHGIEIDANATRQQKIQKIIEQVSIKFDDQAEAANKGLGGIKGLTVAFDNIQKAIGERFAPAFTLAIQNITELFQSMSENKPLLDLIVSLLTAGAVVTGLVTFLGAATLGFLHFKAALEAAKIATSAMTLATQGLVAATGLGLVLVIVTEIALNWNTIWPKMKQVYEAFVNNIYELSSGVGDFLSGIFTFDTDKITAGLDQAKAALKKGYGEIKSDIKPIELEIIQDPKKLELAKKAAKEREEQEKATQEAVQAIRALNLLQTQDASTALVEIKKKEVEILKQIADKNNKENRERLKKNLEDTRAILTAELAIDADQNKEFNNKILKENSDFGNLDADAKKVFLLKNRQALVDSIETETTVREKAAKESIQEDIDAQNELLRNRQKFGKVLGSIVNVINFQAVLEFAQTGISAIQGLADAPKALKTNIDDVVKKENDLSSLRQKDIDKSLAAEQKTIQAQLKSSQITQDQADQAIQAAKDKADVDKKAATDETQASVDRIKKEAEAKDLAAEKALKAQQAGTDLLSKGVGKVVESFLPGLGAFASQIIDLTALGPQAIQKAIDSLLGGLQAAFKSIIASIGPILVSITQAIGPILKTVFENLGPLLQNLVGSLGDIVINVVDGILEGLFSLIDNVDKIIDGIIDGLFKAFESLAEKLPQIIEKLVSEAPKIISTLVQLAPHIIIKLAEELVQKGPEILLSLGKGIAEAFINGILEGFDGIINGIIDVINFLPGVDINHVHHNAVKLAEGGLALGGKPNVDSIPALLSPGEFVVPTRNFDEVINAVVAQRTGKSSGPGGRQDVSVKIGFDSREAQRILTASQKEAKALGISEDIAS